MRDGSLYHRNSPLMPRGLGYFAGWVVGLLGVLVLVLGIISVVQQ